MSAIYPSSIVELYDNIPLTPDYTHTVYYPSKQAQEADFHGGSVQPLYTLNSQMFVRANNNSIKVALPYEQIYKCNYMVFRNNLFENKYFYAFILELNYVNNTTTEIVYKIDVFQTWLTDVSWKRCFIVRQHALSDNIGDNIEPENVSLGEYVYNTYNKMFSTDSLDFILGEATVTRTFNSGLMYNGVYSGSTLMYFKNQGTDTSTNINNYIQGAMARTELPTFTSLYCVPAEFTTGFTNAQPIPVSTSSYTKHYALTGVGNTINGYTPKNNKLFTYPYNFLHVDNASGSELNLRYEFFADKNNPLFRCSASILQPVGVIGCPENYKNTANETLSNRNVTESILLSNYPLCSFTIDTYAAWAAQNSITRGYNRENRIIIPSIKSLASMGTNIASGIQSVLLKAPVRGIANAVGGSISGIADIAGNITSYLQDEYSASVAMDTVKGSTENGSINAVSGNQTFWYGRMSITAQKAMIIDNYFSMFGYATNRVGYPNISGRTAWNYVKTVGCVVVGNNGGLPGDDREEFQKNVDKGITFWKSLANVCNYAQQNDIIPQPG